MIQVRDVPEHVYRTLKSRAAREGMSLFNFLKKELARSAERPTMQEWLERTQHANLGQAKPRASDTRNAGFAVIAATPLQ